MIELKPNKFYRIIFIDRTELDFEAVNTPPPKHLIEVRTKADTTQYLVNLLSEKNGSTFSRSIKRWQICDN